MMVSPQGGAHALVNKKACVLTTDEDMKDLHHRPELTVVRRGSDCLNDRLRLPTEAVARARRCV
jgi:hypothetical protein